MTRKYFQAVVGAALACLTLAVITDPAQAKKPPSGSPPPLPSPQFDLGLSELSIYGTLYGDNITLSTNAAGVILLNGSPMVIPTFPLGSITPTAANTRLLRVYGGDGSDTIDASGLVVSPLNGEHTLGTDVRLIGGNGDDHLIAGSGGAHYTLFGDDPTDLSLVGNDTLDGGPDQDFLVGGPLDDTLNGGGDIDTLWGDYDSTPLPGDGPQGNDTLDGGPGNDFLVGHGGDDDMNGEDDDDTMFGDAGDDRMHGGAGNDDMDGGPDVDKMWGDDGDDTMYGGGNDAVDKMHGGKGFNTAFYTPPAPLLHEGETFKYAEEFQVIKPFTESRLSVIRSTLPEWFVP